MPNWVLLLGTKAFDDNGSSVNTCTDILRLRLWRTDLEFCILYFYFSHCFLCKYLVYFSVCPCCPFLYPKCLFTSLHRRHFSLCLSLPSEMIAKNVVSHITCPSYSSPVCQAKVKSGKTFSVHLLQMYMPCLQFNVQRSAWCIFTTALLLMEFEVFTILMLHLLRYIFTTELSYAKPLSPPFSYILFSPSLPPLP